MYLSDRPQATNTTRDYGLVLSGPEGASLAGQFDGSETFRAILWAGDAQAPLWQSDTAARWDPETLARLDTIDAPEVLLTVPRSAVQGLEEGTYSGQVLLNPDVDDVEVWSGFLQLVESAGTATALPAYTVFEDLEGECPWIGSVQDLGTDQRGFAEAQNWAWGQVNRTLIARAQAEIAGYDRLGVWDPDRRSGLEALPELLAADRLEVTAELRRIGALYALSRVLRPQLGAGGPDGKTSYQTLGRGYLAEARTALLGYRGRVDADGDGVYELVIG